MRPAPLVPKPWLTFTAAVAGIAVVAPHAAVAMMCRVHLSQKLEHFSPITAAWAGTIGARPVSCCLATVVFPGPQEGRIVGRCRVAHFRGRRSLEVSYTDGVIGGDSVIQGTICRQLHIGCCKLAGMATRGYLPTTMVGSYTCRHEAGMFTLTVRLHARGVARPR